MPALSDPPVFRPSFAEFSNFREYLSKIEKKYKLADIGICKVVAPSRWTPRREGYEDIDDLSVKPVEQINNGRHGCFAQMLVERKNITLGAFRDLANSDRQRAPTVDKPEDLERKFWRSLLVSPAFYGADVPGSLFDEGVKEWNPNSLDSLLQDKLDRKLPGVNEPMLYVGMWKAAFSWHTEDMDLYSINYLHCGEPKFWYCVPPEYGHRLESLAQGKYPQDAMVCSEFMRHKTCLISPATLDQNNIPYRRMIHYPREFVITWPYAYHSGFNLGFNIAESVNFALPHWIQYGLEAKSCQCQKGTVHIDMDIFDSKKGKKNASTDDDKRPLKRTKSTSSKRSS